MAASTLAASGLVRPDARELPPTSRADIELQLKSQGNDLVADADLDGLADALEAYAYGTDPGRWNSSGSPIPDGWLAQWGFDPLDPAAPAIPFRAPPANELPASYRGVWPARFSPSLLETYRFGRPADWSEATQGPFQNGIDPRLWDGNGDGLPDGWLLVHGVDPDQSGLATLRLAGDRGLTVREAFEAGTDPTRLDSDNDGLEDTAELAGSGTWNGRPVTFPRSDPSAYSTSGTGVCDGYLVGHGLDPTQPRSALDDADHDGASTASEFRWSLDHSTGEACRKPVGLDPTRARSGGAPIPDGWFLRYGLDALTPGAADLVTDRAGNVTLRASDEYGANRPTAWDESRSGPWLGGSDPTNADTDGDGLGDADEVVGWVVNVTRVPGGTPTATRVTSDPTSADADADGLADGDERDEGTDPHARDTDFDGLRDGDEVALALDLAGEDSPENATRLDARRSDSVGDLMRDGDRLRLLEARQDLARSGDSYPFLGPNGPQTLDEVAHAQAGGETLPVPATPDQLAALFAPDGDTDGDKMVNLLDADIDDDGLVNGVETDPVLYERAGFAPTTQPRSASDPLNKDTDADGLFDGWEVENSRVQEVDGSDANIPDPANPDSDGDGDGDGADDQDGDGALVTLFSGGVKGTLDATHTNLDEQTYRTDPWEVSSDGDGLSDGWKTYWGMQYSGPRELQEVPLIGLPQPDVVVLPTATFLRHTLEPSALGPQDTLVGAPFVVHLTSGTRTLQAVETTVPWTFLSVQANGTNPYLSDSDGDTLDDLWETYHGRLHLRSPLDATAGQCTTTGKPDPLSYDAGGLTDHDGDGLNNRDELLAGSDPVCKDSDLGGLDDKKELDAFLDPTDPTDDLGGVSGGDRDDDGISDLAEVQAQPPTSPMNPDSDGDGLLDGASRDLAATAPLHSTFTDLGIAYTTVPAGRRFLGEAGFSAPTVADSRLAGVPDGWILAHGGAHQPWWRACYEYGLPIWWDLDLHGPWWGGGNPFSDGGTQCTSLASDPDRDRDGLRDVSGEDPIPVASRSNQFTPSDPFGPGLSAQEVRLRAQSAIDPRDVTSTRVQRATITAAPPTQRPASIALDPGPTTLVLGETLQVTGTLTGPDGPVAFATVLARLAGPNGEDFGAACTDGNGRFALAVEARTAHEVAVPPGCVLKSQTAGTVRWSTPVAGLAPGSRTLHVVSYSTAERSAGPAQAAHEPAAPVSLALTLQHRVLLEASAPEVVRPGAAFNVRILETDASGAARSDPVSVKWAGQDLGARTPNRDGVLTLSLTAPASGLEAALDLATTAATNVLPGTAHAAIRLEALATLALDPMTRADAGEPFTVSGRAFTPAGPLPSAPVAMQILGPSGAALAESETVAGPKGTFQSTLNLPYTLAPGTYVLSASMPAATGHGPASSSANLAVRGRVVLLDAAPASLGSSGNRTLDVRLVDAAGAPVAGRSLALEVGGEQSTATTGGDGVAHFFLHSTLARGPHLQAIRFDGDSAYAPAEVERERLVRGPTSLSLKAADATPGGTLHAVVRLTDESGQGLAGRVVRVQLDDGTGADTLTGPDGRAAADLPVRQGASLGLVGVKATFNGDGAGSYSPTQNRTLARLALPTRFVVPPGPFLVGDLPQGTLLDARDRPVAGATVHVEVDSVALVTRTTGADGRFPLLSDSPGDAAEILATMRFPEDPGHDAASLHARLAFRLPASLRASIPDLVVGQAAVVEVVGLDAAGRRVESGDVSIAIGPQTFEAPLLGGVARIAIRVDGDVIGAIPTTVTLDSPSHAAPALAREMSIFHRTDLDASFGTRRSGGLVRIDLQAESGGRPLPFARLVVLSGDRMASFTVTTDEDGKATVQLPVPEATVPLQVRFAGDGQSAPALLMSSLDPSLVAPQAGPTAGGLVAAGAAAALVLLAAAVAIAARRRRHPVLDALLAAQRVLDADGPFQADILACYATLEDHLVAAGILRGKAPTPRMLAEALVAAVPLGAGRPALDSLIRAFERTRYSGQRAGPTDRDAARTSLRSLRRALMRTGVAVPMEAA